MSEIAIEGVLISPLLLQMAVAFLLNAVLRRVLARLGVYRLVWHRALFDFSLFVVLLGGVVALATQWMPS